MSNGGRRAPERAAPRANGGAGSVSLYVDTEGSSGASWPAAAASSRSRRHSSGAFAAGCRNPQRFLRRFETHFLSPRSSADIAPCRSGRIAGQRPVSDEASVQLMRTERARWMRWGLSTPAGGALRGGRGGRVGKRRGLISCRSRPRGFRAITRSLDFGGSFSSGR